MTYSHEAEGRYTHSVLRLALYVLLFLPLTGAQAPVGTVASKAVAGKLEARYRGAHTLKATFFERYSENGQTTRTEAGTAYFQRPGKMRWDYESPEKNTFLVDGKTAWFYVPTDHTVTRAPAKQSSDWRTPLALLAGEMKLSRVCARIEAIAITAEKPETLGDAMLYCQLRGERNEAGKIGKSAPSDGNGPLQDPGVEDAVYLEVQPDMGNLARVLVREKGGMEIEFKFANWEFDPRVPDSFFRFNVPMGVTIVNGISSEL